MTVQLYIDGSVLVSTLWPRGLPMFIKGEHLISNVNQAGHVVPSHEDGLRSWCYVAVDHDSNQAGVCKFLAYSSTRHEQPEEIAFRFQGFVRDAHLETYGTWNG